MVEIRIATQQDAELVERDMNPFQEKLILGLGDHTTRECVSRAFGGSVRTWAGLVDGELVAVWGVYPLEGGCGYPWLFSLPAIAKHRKAALVIGRRAIGEMLAIFPRLFGLVDHRFEASVRYAKHLGFNIGQYPVEEPFVTIERTT